MTIESYIDCIRAVLAKYPDARIEYPNKLCSVSTHFRGPEISRRCYKAKAAWLDAFRRLGVQPRPVKH